MSRRTSTKKKLPLQDPLFNIYAISLFANKILKNGKKTVSYKIIKKTFDLIYKRTKRNPLKVFETAVKNTCPKIEVKSTRVGGSNYQIPREVKTFRAINLSLRWILESTRKKTGKKMVLQLTNELIDASNGLGNAVRKKQETHKMAKANKAFAHFRY
jgi:small subunit ribosomal protein S7